MRRIIPLELAAYNFLEFDLYDENGEILLRKGDKLTSNILMMLSFKKVYVQEKPLYAIDFDSEIPYLIPEGVETQSIISEKAASELIKNTKKILKASLEGNVPDLNTCENTRDIIVEEIGEKIAKIECIGQLRVYDEYTFSHTVNVSTLSSALAISLGLPESQVKDLALGALLHDVGKMRIPLQILNKPDKLTKEEFEIIKNHTVFGYQLIVNELKLSDDIAEIALHHQERYSGGGYPHGLAGNDISHFSQITSIADVYDALVSKRVYKDSILSHEALKIMTNEGSSSFNPSLLYKFVYLANYKDSAKFITEQ